MLNLLVCNDFASQPEQLVSLFPAGNCAAELSDKSQLGTPDDATKSSNMANASCSDDAVVHTSLGEIHGRLVMSPRFSPEGTEVQVEQYLGIPYAVPPVGELRFTNPEPFGQFPGGTRGPPKQTFPGQFGVPKLTAQR